MQKKIDCIGIDCPGPVINVKKEIDANFVGTLEVIVDNVAARENILRFLKSQGKQVSEVLEDGKIITVIANFGETSDTPSEEVAPSTTVKTVQGGVTYIINSDIMGRGDETLGKKLFIGFLNNLPEIEPLPQTIFFYNNGINFTTEGAPTLAAIKELESRGTEIITCGTCTEFHGVTEKLGVGILGNLYDLTSLLQRDRAISL